MKVMKRQEILNSYEKHAWLKKVYARLNASDKAMIERFIADNDGLDKHNFEFAINRMFLDKNRPKNYKLILELLTCCNSAL
jgi:hypothetical protein